jgi:soluble lytic murein transglycosylase
VTAARGEAAFFAQDPHPHSLQRGRAAYLDLREAVRDGRWSDFEVLREELARYPLEPYADYELLMARLRVTDGERARAFVDANSRSPLGVRYLGNYLDVAGRDRRWGDFLAAAEQEPRSEKLRCYYARAKRGRGAQEEAWDLARRLFLSSSSVDKACDPLFRLWKEQGGLTPDLIWARAKLAFAAREGGLLRYVASLGGPAAPLDALRRVYREPQRTPALVSGLEQPYRSEVLVLGLERHSRYAPARSLQQYRNLAPDALDARQRAQVEAAIALRGLIEREPGVRSWVDAGLARWNDSTLTALRLRWAIAENDWPSVEQTSTMLAAADTGEGAWTYWRARALSQRGAGTEADRLFAALAQKRSYYGFLSADRLGLPYAFEERPLPPLDAAGADEILPDWLHDATWRVHELNAIDSPRLAHAEWTHALQRTDDNAKLVLARVAGDQGWHRLAIDAANAGRAWDALDLRFPLAYVDAFQTRASLRDLPASELMAIARRESAFFPGARSPVGARGLMQLMPSTGVAVARSNGIRLDVSELYDVDHNLDLGSAYYRQLLDRFDGNRAVALAAYNAGPNRVQHWVGKDLPVDAWIETIPYRETRDYVKAVLAYTVVFDHRLGREARLLTAAERDAHY